MTSPLRSQQVTPADRASGQIRVPTASKSAFPRTAGPLRVVVRGTAIDGRWNPRIGQTGSGQGRSGSGMRHCRASFSFLPAPSSLSPHCRTDRSIFGSGDAWAAKSTSTARRYVALLSCRTRAVFLAANKNLRLERYSRLCSAFAPTTWLHLNGPARSNVTATWR